MLSAIERTFDIARQSEPGIRAWEKMRAEDSVADEMNWFAANPAPAPASREAPEVVRARLAEERRIRNVLGYASTAAAGGRIGSPAPFTAPGALGRM